eukprot:4909747-Pyramimonas_sp.AAC.1
MPSVPKRMRTVVYGRSSHATAAATAALMADIQREGLPEAFSASTLARHREARVMEDTSFGPVLVEKRLGSSDVRAWFQHPFAWLEAACRTSPSYQEMFLELAAKHHGTMNVYIYSDEIVPGNVLDGKNRRKTQAFYWSFAELGFPALSNELCWNTIAAMRSSILDDVVGGVSTVMKECLKLFFGLPAGPDLR